MIKTFEKQMIEDVMNIWLSSNIETHSYIDASYWQSNYEAVKNAILEADIWVYTNEQDVIVGFLGIGEDNYIAGIFVDKNYRNKSIGQNLLNNCKKTYEYLKLSVYAKNIKAINFYKRNNFIIKSSEKDELNNELEYHMFWKK